MDVSVVVPTRNRSALLATTLRSVLRQRDVDFEVIVVDEASTDDTQTLLPRSVSRGSASFGTVEPANSAWQTEARSWLGELWRRGPMAADNG